MPSKTQLQSRASRKVTLAQQVATTDWAFRDADTKKLTHEIHRYSGKYIPQIAHQAIELISAPGDLIVDPYVGSGTTLLEANILNRKSHGLDINPLAILISKVKTTPIPSEKLKKLRTHFEEIISDLESQEGLFGDRLNSVKISALKDARFTDPWFMKWFTKSVLGDLLILDYFIDRYQDEDCKNLARVALSNILRKCSNAHGGYPNVMLDKDKSNRTKPGRPFFKSLSENIDRVESLNEIYNPRVSVGIALGNAKNINFKTNSVDAIVTHPPYIGSVPYAEYGLLSLKWLGHDPKKLDAEITGGKRQTKDVVSRFMSDYEKMLTESYRVLKPSKYLFILIGDPTVKGKLVDLAAKTKELAHLIGFKLAAEKMRDGVNRRANKMGPETVLFFQKV